MKRTVYLSRFFEYLITSVDQTPLNTDEKTRLQHFTVFLSLGIPTMVVYGIYNLIRADYTLSAMIGVSAVGLAFGWYLLRKIRKGAIVYRVNSVLFGLLILYMLVIGGDGGSKILWMYTFPLIAFFLFGKNEGLAWSSAVFAVALLFLALPLNQPFVYAYAAEFKIRFATTYVIVSAVTYWFEYFRYSYRTGMEAERRNLEAEIDQRRRAEQQKEQVIEQLQEAFEEVKTLSGLIPICAKCYRVRDDQGYWNRLERYIQDRSGAQFSHSICPACSEELYPGIQTK